jgi:hypothetical protein
MTEIDLSYAVWRKSSYSGQSGNCVEVARNLPGPGGLAGDLAGVYQERLKTWLVSVAVPLRENAVR